MTGVAGFIGRTSPVGCWPDSHDVVGVDALRDYYDPHLRRENPRSIAHPQLQLVISAG